MAPARPRATAAAADDSRSETPGLTTTGKAHDRHSILGPNSHSSVHKSGSGGRSSRPAQNGNSSSAAVSAAAERSRHIAAGGSGNAGSATAGTSAGGGSVREEKQLPKINWSTLPTPVLHRYRQHLAPSSIPPPHLSHPHASAFLGHGIGLSSPSSVYYAKKRKAQLSQPSKKEKRTGKQNGHAAGQSGGKGLDGGGLGGSGRIGKNELAMAVRKHFNGMAVNEGEVMARFAYLVRGGGGGGGPGGGVEREFRLRFRP